jgi:hypothetical protein
LETDRTRSGFKAQEWIPAVRLSMADKSRSIELRRGDYKMRIRSTALLTALAIGILGVWLPSAVAADTSVTGGGGGVYPPDTSFSGVPINGLEFGYGVYISSSTVGQVAIVLLGIAAGDVQQRIKIQGEANGGQRTAANAAVFSGTCALDMGDGTPPIPGVPFTVTVTTNANDQGTLGLVIGETTLPNAVLNSGSMTIKTP